ncbi:MAG: aromatic hydrocarbon degradation protein [Bacteroidales bacterium]
MKKLFMFIVSASLAGSLFAGGLVTNTNQSALYARLQSRNASTAIDAVYYNPAGLTRLNDGIHFSVNNQTIGQTRAITSNYPYLAGTPKEYPGTVSAPLFPSVYAAYKMGRFAVSAGFNPIGGGGGAKYEDGLPSFEMDIASLVPLLSAQGFPTTQYSADIFFEGSSIYFGYQANVSYEISDMISVAAGVRMVTAKNTFNGYLRDISINPNYPAFGPAYNGSMVLASTFFTSGATTLSALQTGANAYYTGLDPIVTGGGGSTLLTDGGAFGLTPTDIATIQTIMGAAGQTTEQIGTATIAYAQTVLGASAPVFGAGSTQMTTLAGQTQDVTVEAEQTGRGFTPIVGVNLNLSDNLNVSLKYEFQTKLELTTKVNNNMGGGIFIDGEKVIADMPALLAMGFEYKPVDKLMLTGSMNVFFDKKVDYDGSADIDVNMIDKNFKEVAFGAQFAVNDKLRASAGWLGTYTGVNSNYISDQRYSTNTNSFGGGIGYRITPMIDLNIGGAYTIYDLGEKEYNYLLGGVVPVPVKETYDKATWIIAVGLDFYFGR